MSIKISQPPAASSIANTAIFPIVQNSTTEKATIIQLGEVLGTGPGFQVNGVGLINSDIINFVAGSNIALSNPTAGNIVITANNGGGGGNVSLLVVSTGNTSAPGQFVVAHSLGATPNAAIIQMTSGGQIWLDTSNVALGYDSANVYCVASEANVSGQVIVFG